MFVESPRTPLAIAILAFFGSIVFSVFIYPTIADPLQSNVAGDGYDQLAFGLYQSGTLSFYPNPQPTLMRGPAYPAFVALFLFLNESWYPLNVQVGQGILHSLSSALCFAIASLFWSRTRAAIASLMCALHPFLLWYTPRIVVETAATFLFTMIVYSFLVLQTRPSYPKSIVLGVVLGISALCKATFLPVALLVPFLTFIVSREKRRATYSLVVLSAAFLIILPWSLRNYDIVDTVIPVHTLMGLNMRQGDCLAENYARSPRSYMQALNECGPHVTSGGDTLTDWRLEGDGVQNSVEVDRSLAQQSIERYCREPWFFARKLVLNAIMFWTLSASVPASLVTSILQIPLLAVFIFVAVKTGRKHGFLSARNAPILLVLCYYGLHLPIYALARFGVVLVPVMLAYCAGFPLKPEATGR